MKLSRIMPFLVVLLLLSSASFAAELNVADMGAIGDGIKDNTVIFQKALDEAGKAGGGIVNVPAGHWVIKGNLSIPKGVTLQGTFRSAPDASDANALSGSVLLTYAGRGSEEGKPFIELDTNSVVAGFIIYYPEAKQSDVPPVPYPPCIAGKFAALNPAVLDMNILNPWEAIHFVSVHRFLIRNVHGYPIKRGIFVDECYDIGRVENIHFWPYAIAYKPDDPYCKWINLNGIAFEFARTDWQYVANTFCFGYGVGYKFSEYKAGGCNGNFLGIGADSCERAVLVEQAQPAGLLITNGEFVGRWSSENATTCEIGEKVVGKVSLTNCSFWGPINKCVWMRSTAGQFTANSCHFLSWDSSGKGFPAIQLDSGNVILQGNTFADGQLHVNIGPKVKSAIVMGNQTGEELNVKNQIGKKAVLFGNSANTVNFTQEARMSYRLDVGSDGDARYIKNWSGREPALEWNNKGTKRWSLPGSQFILPVVPGKQYTVTLDVSVPQFAVMAGTGLYMGNKQIIKITKAGNAVLTGTIPAGTKDTVTLDLKVKNWYPKDVIPNNTDARHLGAAVRTITMQAKGAGKKVFDANTGEWIK